MLRLDNDKIPELASRPKDFEVRIIDVDDNYLRLIHCLSLDDQEPVVEIYHDGEFLLVMTSILLDDAIEVLTKMKRQLREREKEYRIQRGE